MKKRRWVGIISEEALESVADLTIDAKGKKCPLPIVMISQAIRGIGAGKTIEVTADDLAFGEDVKAFCRVSGHSLESLKKVNNAFIAVIKKA